MRVNELKKGDKFHLFNDKTGKFGKLVYLHLDYFYECESGAEDEDGNYVRVGDEDIVQKVETTNKLKAIKKSYWNGHG